MPELMGGGEKRQQLTGKLKKRKEKNLVGLNYISRGLLMKLNSSHEENSYSSPFSNGGKYSTESRPVLLQREGTFMLGETLGFIKISCVFHLIYTCFACWSIRDKGMTSRNGTLS